MADEVRIKFFEVEKCGYYRRGSTTPEFGGLEDMLADIGAWVGGKSLSETATYEPSDEQDGNLLRTFCYGINTLQNGDTLLTTWNETPTTEGAVASVQLSGQVNTAAVSTSPVRRGYVTGYPAYFWFPHDTGKYATIQVRNRLNGRSNLRNFFRGFLEKYAKHVVLDPIESTSDEDVIAGYAEDGNPEEIKSVRPSYRCGLVRLPGEIDFLRQNRSRIRRVEQRDVLNYQVQEDVSLWQSVWRGLTGDDSGTLSGKHRLRLDVECEPTDEEFESIVEHWQTDQGLNGSQGRFHDVGFRLQGDAKTYWLSRSLASDVIELELSFSNEAVLDGDTLLRQLSRRRQRVLSLASEVEHATA